MNAQRFLFGEDLGTPARQRRVETEQASLALIAADRDGFARGREAGRAEALADQSRRLADAVERVGGAAFLLLENSDARTAAVEEDALAFFEALARALAGEAVAAEPLARVSGAGLEAFRHLRGAPHLAVRVHESLVEPVEALLRRMARERGFEGRLIVLGADDMAPGDARIEWADGGVVSDRAALDEAVARVIAGAAAPGTRPEQDRGEVT